MKRDIKSISKIGTTYMGAVIGAAFASGQEIQQFFNVFGPYGFLGILLATVLFCLFGVIVLCFSESIRAKSYYDFIENLFGKRVSKFIDVPIAIILLAGLGIMLAGSGALFKQQLGLPKELGILLMSVIVIVIMWGGIRLIYMVNLVLMPVKIILTSFLSVNIIAHRGIDWSVPLTVEPKVAGGWAVASVLYVSYNMLLTAVVLCTIYVPGQKRTNIVGGVVGGLGLGILAFLIAAVCFSFYPNSMYYQVPMVYIAGYYSPVFQYAYGMVIWLAILTAAVSSGYGFSKRVAHKTGFSYRLVGVVSVIIVLPLVKVSFMDLVSSIYPMFGYFGIVILAGLLLVPFRRYISGVFRKNNFLRR